MYDIYKACLNMYPNASLTLDLFLQLAWQAEAAEAALAAARAELEAAARDDISPSRTQAARERIAALEADCCRLKVHALPQPLTQSIYLQ